MEWLLERPKIVLGRMESRRLTLYCRALYWLPFGSIVVVILINNECVPIAISNMYYPINGMTLVGDSKKTKGAKLIRTAGSF
jgi:hypothetical protein